MYNVHVGTAQTRHTRNGISSFGTQNTGTIKWHTAIKLTNHHAISRRLAGLLLDEPVVEAFPREQLQMVAQLDDASVAHDDDQVRVLDRRQTVGNHEAGAAGARAVQRLLDDLNGGKCQY